MSRADDVKAITAVLKQQLPLLIDKDENVSDDQKMALIVLGVNVVLGIAESLAIIADKLDTK